jgi:hypothetical protein
VAAVVEVAAEADLSVVADAKKRIIMSDGIESLF